MNHDNSYQTNGRLISMVATGEYGVDTVFQGLQEALADPTTPELALVLFDARKATVQGTTVEVRRAADLALRMASRIDRVAIVVTTDLHFGLIRMVGGFLEGSTIQVSPFHNLEDAHAFLGVDPPESNEA
jgi:hypothetical protein